MKEINEGETEMTNVEFANQIDQEMLEAGYCTKHNLDFSAMSCEECDDEDCFAQYCPKCRYVSDIDAAFRDEYRAIRPADYAYYPGKEISNDRLQTINAN